MDALNFKHVFFKNTNPIENLAIEELIAQTISAHEVIFLLYRNSNAVVVGKNQNPWLETDPDWLNEQKIPLLRRISGGGTVWHDLGNLCYSFIYKQGSRIEFENHQFLIDSLAALGIDLIRNDRGDLLLNGYKCSGNALCHKQGVTIHHGTLLIGSNLDLLRRALKPIWLGPYSIEKRGIQSLRVQVTQFSDHHPGVSIDRIAIHLLHSWIKKNESETFNLDGLLAQKTLEFDKIRKRHESWEWVFGRSPQFMVESNDEKFAVIDGFVEKTMQFDQWIRLQKQGALWNND